MLLKGPGVVDVGVDAFGLVESPMINPLDSEDAHTPVDCAGCDVRDPVAVQIRGHLPPAIQPLWGESTPSVRVGGEAGVEDGIDDHRVADGPGRWLPRRPPGPVGPRGDLAALLTKHSADRLDRVALSPRCR
jgi:hypothetical protein